MTNEQTELFHQSILRVLDRNATRYGLGAPALTVLVNEFGFSPTAEEMNKALAYLADPALEFVALVDKGHAHSFNQSWKLTAKGTNYLRSRGF